MSQNIGSSNTTLEPESKGVFKSKKIDGVSYGMEGKEGLWRLFVQVRLDDSHALMFPGGTGGAVNYI